MSGISIVCPLGVERNRMDIGACSLHDQTKVFTNPSFAIDRGSQSQDGIIQLGDTVQAKGFSPFEVNCQETVDKFGGSTAFSCEGIGWGQYLKSRTWGAASRGFSGLIQYKQLRSVVDLGIGTLTSSPKPRLNQTITLATVGALQYFDPSLGGHNINSCITTTCFVIYLLQASVGVVSSLLSGKEDQEELQKRQQEAFISIHVKPVVESIVAQLNAQEAELRQRAKDLEASFQSQVEETANKHVEEAQAKQQEEQAKQQAEFSEKRAEMAKQHEEQVKEMGEWGKRLETLFTDPKIGLTFKAMDTDSFQDLTSLVLNPSGELAGSLGYFKLSALSVMRFSAHVALAAFSLIGKIFVKDDSLNVNLAKAQVDLAACWIGLKGVISPTKGVSATADLAKKYIASIFYKKIEQPSLDGLSEKLVLDRLEDLRLQHKGYQLNTRKIERPEGMEQFSLLQLV